MTAIVLVKKQAENYFEWIVPGQQTEDIANGDAESLADACPSGASVILLAPAEAVNLSIQAFDESEKKVFAKTLPYTLEDDLVEDIDKFSLDQFFDDRDNWAIKPQKWLQNPQKTFEDSEFMNILQKCLEKISPKQADAFRLREFSQFDTEEICKVLNISTTNYWVLMHRARQYMRRCLEIKWFSPESGKRNL